MSKTQLFSNKCFISKFAKWLALILVLITSFSFGQSVQNYSFSQSQGVYNELENPTIIEEATLGSGLWNNRYDVSIPFSFPFNGSNYSTLKVHSYGFLTFGSESPFGYVPISSSNYGYPDYQGAIAPFAGSITAYNFSENDKGSISYKLVGEAPNRKLIIQWKNYSYFYNNNLPASLPQNAFKLGFQVHLSENGEIEFVYNLLKTGTGSPSPTNFTTQIGLRGLTNSEFTNRSTPGSSTTQNLNSTTKGNENSATSVLNSNFLPTSGVTFKWTLPEGCEAPTAQPTNLSLTKTGIVINGSFMASNPAADKYLILRTAQGQTSNNPINGTTYSIGENSNLNAYVVYYGSNTTFENNYNSGAVRGNNTYTYKIYSVSSDCTGGPLYLLQTPLSDTITNCPISLNGMTVGSVTQNSFVLSWPIGENGNALPMNRVIEVSTDSSFNNMVPGSPFTLNASDLSLSITGLSPNTRYYYRGKNTTSLCESDFSSTANIYTTCLATTSFNETFDQVTGNVLPNCWSKIIVSETSSVPTINVTTTYANSAPNGVTFYGNGAEMTNLNNKAILVSPELSNVGQGTHRLRFNAKMSSSGGTYDLQVVALSSNTADATIEVIGTITASELSPNYQQFTVNFNNYSGNANYVGIRRINGETYSYLCVDDITWEAIPSCPELQSITSNSTADGATVNWVDSMGVPTNGYEYFISSTSNIPSEDETFETTTNSTIQVTGLSNGTYYVFVRRACSGEDKSPWRQTTFSTVQTAPVPWLEEFGNSTPLGWSMASWGLGTSAGYPGNPGMNLYKNLYGTGLYSSGTFTTIPVGPLSSNSFELSFDYRQGNYNSPYAPLTSWGNFTIEVSSDFGQTWTQIGVVDNEHGNQNSSYIHKVFSLSGYQSEYVKVRIVATRTAGDYYLSFDNFEIKQPASIVENVVVSTENNSAPEILIENGVINLNAVVNPSGTSQEVIWSIVTGTDLATINQNGILTAVSNGLVTVRATSVADETKYGEIQITINFETQNTGCDGAEPGMNIGDTGCVSFTYNGQTVTYATVRGADGNIWLQQNLGSVSVATSSTDNSAYGDLFQWGRWDDGHQKRTSEMSTNTLSPNNPLGLNGGNGYFYVTDPEWWDNGNTTDKWEASLPQNVSDVNGCDPCKALGAEWSIPTSDQWESIINLEQITNIQTAFDSNLKLTVAGARGSSGVYNDGVRGYYWSKTTSDNPTYAKYLYYSNFIVNTNAGGFREQGSSLRCIKALQAQTDITSVEVAVENDEEPFITTQNGTLQLVATVNPTNVNQNVAWSIESDNSSATVDSAGLVTANANGSVLVRATSTVDSTKFGEINVTINIEDSEAGYCIPEFFYPSSQAGIAINKISLEGESITWNVDQIEYNETGYADYTNSQSVDLILGNSYDLGFHTNWQDPHFINVRAWIDYNNNNQFDADEEIGYYNNGIDPSGDGSFTFTVPNNTNPGTYRLRVMLQFPNSQPDNLHPCGTINSYGIAVDYNVEVIEGAVTPEDEYCNVTVEYGVEPITLVNFSDLNNQTSAIVDGTPAYENFTSMVANIARESSYTLTVKGNTNGEFEHDIRVFIDWNQDNTFDMDTEFYTVSLAPSTGEDNVEATISIPVPSDALLGNTRMRIIKDMWNVYEDGEFDACTDAYYGQIEDYTVNVQEATAGIKPFDKASIVIYPNPSTGIFNVSTQISLDRIEVYNVSGQRILTSKTNEINLTQAASGVYFLNVYATDGTQNTYKVVKK